MLLVLNMKSSVTLLDIMGLLLSSIGGNCNIFCLYELKYSLLLLFQLEDNWSIDT